MCVHCACNSKCTSNDFFKSVIDITLIYAPTPTFNTNTYTNTKTREERDGGERERDKVCVKQETRK